MQKLLTINKKTPTKAWCSSTTVVNFEQMSDLYDVTPWLSVCSFNILEQVIL